MERRKKSNTLYLLLLLLVVTGCRTTKNVDTGNIKGDITIEELTQMQAFTPAPTSISSKIKMKARVGDKEFSAAGSLGIDEDKGVRIGITALGLFEVARIEITPTSALLINKVDDEYASLGDGALGVLQQAGLNYNVLQSIFMNIPFTPDGKDITGTLSAMNIARVGDDITLVAPKRGATQYTFNVSATTGELLQTSGIYNQSVKVDCCYSDFDALGGRNFPHKIRLEVQGAGIPLVLDLSLNNVREGKFNFKSTDIRSMKEIDLSRLLNIIK